MTLQEKIAVMQAALDGKPIQIRDAVYSVSSDDFSRHGREWIDDTFDFTEPGSFNFRAFEYRVKPEPQEFLAVPFVDAPESISDRGVHKNLLYALMPATESPEHWAGTIRVRVID